MPVEKKAEVRTALPDEVVSKLQEIRKIVGELEIQGYNNAVRIVYLTQKIDEILSRA